MVGRSKWLLFQQVAPSRSITLLILHFQEVKGHRTTADTLHSNGDILFSSIRSKSVFYGKDPISKCPMSGKYVKGKNCLECPDLLIRV